MTACGKAHYFLKMLEEEYKNHFDYIVIVYPTLQDNKMYPKICKKYKQSYHIYWMTVLPTKTLKHRQVNSLT